MSKKPGYILLLTLMLTSMSVLLISTVLYKTSVLSRIAVVFSQRENAKTLARSGIEIALSQLNSLKPQKEKDTGSPTGDATNGKKKQQDQSDERKEFYANLLAIINRWQTFELSEKDFEVAGVIKIYIACEQGKINIGKLYDFKHDTFAETKTFDGEKVAGFIFDNLGQKNGMQKKLLGAFQDFMKNRTFALQDISELLLMKELQKFKGSLFPKLEPEKQTKDKKPPLYLMDLFTIETDDLTIDPLVLTESVSSLLGLSRQSTVDGKKWVKDLHEGDFDWEKDWDKILAPLYKKEFKALPDPIKSFISSKSDPSIFSVLIHASVGKISQKMYAIVHKDTKKDRFAIRKLYWL